MRTHVNTLIRIHVKYFVKIQLTYIRCDILTL